MDTDTHTGTRHVNRKAEAAAICLQAGEPAEEDGGGHGFSFTAPEGSRSADTSTLTSGLQNRPSGSRCRFVSRPREQTRTPGATMRCEGTRMKMRGYMLGDPGGGSPAGPLVCSPGCGGSGPLCHPGLSRGSLWGAGPVHTEETNVCRCSGRASTGFCHSQRQPR